VIVTSIEMMTNQETILIVQRKQQAHYLLQASKVIRAFFLKKAIRDATLVAQNAEDMQRLIADVSDERMEEIKDLFRMFDVDGNGSITAEELVKAMTTLGDPITFDEASQIISSLDRVRPSSCFSLFSFLSIFGDLLELSLIMACRQNPKLSPAGWKRLSGVRGVCSVVCSSSPEDGRDSTRAR
jgi:hypothetical protein